MTKRILITGAGGFIGTNVLKVLAHEDVELILVVRGSPREYHHIPRVKEVVATSDLFSESEIWWRKRCRGVDAVLHLAWFMEPSSYPHAPQNLECLVGSINLAKAAVAENVKKFIGAGTCFEYEIGSKALSVETPLSPSTLYGASKAALFLALSRHFQLTNVDFAWCRLFYLYGREANSNEDSGRLVPYIRRQLLAGLPALLTSGEQIRDFMEIEIAAQTLSEIVLGNQVGPVNVCTGSPTSVRELALRISLEFDRPDLLHFGGRDDDPFNPPYLVGVPN